MKTKTMHLQALTPEYLTARVLVREAREALRDARWSTDAMTSQNQKHAEDLAKIRQGWTGEIITNQVALLRGSGSGAMVAHRRCRHTDDMELCDHDPLDPIYTADELAAAEERVTDDDLALRRAETKLTKLEPESTFNAADQGGYLWWPVSRFVDPRKHSYRGQRLTGDELSDLGPHELRRLINAGAIVEVGI